MKMTETEVHEKKNITINIFGFGRDIIIVALILYWLLRISDWLFGLFFK